jgi:hypothetical protein
LRSLTADQRLVLGQGRFDHLQGSILPDGIGGWRYQLEGTVLYDTAGPPDTEAVLAGLSDEREAAVVADLAYIEYLDALADFERLLRSKGQWRNPHPWLFTFLRGSNAERVAGDILNGLINADVGPFGRINYYPMRTNTVRTPLARLPDGRIAFAFNIIRMPRSDDVAEAEPMIAANRTLFERIRAAGGIQYPVGAFPTTRSDWQGHFGPAWSLLRDAKRRYDPDNILTPGYAVF